MPKSIVVTALVGEIGARVAKEVAKNLDQVFCNLETCIQNHLSATIFQNFGQQNLKMLEQHQICLALYRGGVVFVPFDVLLHNQDLFAEEKKFYVYVPKSALSSFDVAGQIAFADRDMFLQTIAQKIDLGTIDEKMIAKEIIKKARTKQ